MVEKNQALPHSPRLFDYLRQTHSAYAAGVIACQQ